MNLFTYQALGYFASALIVVSLMMRSLLKLRLLNLVGAGTMAIYGLVIQAYPVLILNALIVCIDIYYLQEMFMRKDYFNLLAVRQDSKYLAYFLLHYAAEIRKFLPNFTYPKGEELQVHFVLRNLVPAGLFIARRKDDCMFIELDFVIPGYRDLKIGRFVFKPDSEFFWEAGIRFVYSYPGTPKHQGYLRKMGFQPHTTSDGRQLYRLLVD